MNIQCSGCGKSYRIDPARLAGRDRARVQCPACRTVFEVGVEAAKAPSRPAAAPTQVQRAPEPAASGLGAAEDSTLRSKRSAHLPAGAERGDRAPALPAGKRVSLAVLSGPEQGKMLGLSRPRMVIGRADADLVLADPEASRQHAVVEAYEDVFLVRDLGSTNGTFVGDEKITAQELGNRDEFRVGSSRLMLIVTEEEV